MFKRFLAALFALVAATAFAAVDVNKATQAELEGIKGIGPAIAGKILDERKKGNFKDWTDMVDRVKGVGEGNAAKFSTEGLTVNGSAFKGAPAKPVTDAKPAADAKPAVKAADVKPVDKAADTAKATDKPAKVEKAMAPAAAAAKMDKPAIAASAAKASDKPAADDKPAKKSKKAEAAEKADKADAAKASDKADKKAAKKADKAAAAASAAKK